MEGSWGSALTGSYQGRAGALEMLGKRNRDMKEV